MKVNRLTNRWGMFAVMLAVSAMCLQITPSASAQNDAPRRQVRAYIPPDQLVSFLPSTSFDRFIDYLDPIFARVAGKQIVDPLARNFPIGVSISSMHFLDAFETVLQHNGLVYTESPDYFIVAERTSTGEVAIEGTSGGGDGLVEQLASLDTREIQINAILFELDHNMARDLGIDWNIFFGDTQSGGQGGSGGGGGGGGAGGENNPRFFLKTGELFDEYSDWLIAPDQIDFSKITQFFRLLETEGAGETIASPQVTVTSGEQGRIQIGSDVPFQVRDFAGNTVTQFFSTGIIVDVTPTLISEANIDSGEAIDFLHLDVKVEKSGSSPSATGPVIDRNTAQTKVLLLDGEQTVIGGLYSTSESVSRTGIPILRQMPLLKYIFGRKQRTITQKELLIVLQANIIDSLADRYGRPFPTELLESNRRAVERSMQTFDARAAAKREKATKYRQN